MAVFSSGYCKVTGLAKGQPAPCFIPMMPVLSHNEQAQLFGCRITMASHMDHNYVPVIEFGKGKGLGVKSCKITGHVAESIARPVPLPEETQESKRVHRHKKELRYMEPFLSRLANAGEKAVMEALLEKMQSGTELDASHAFVYALHDRRTGKTGIVVPHAYEEAIRSGTIESIMLSGDSNSLVVRLRDGPMCTIPMDKMSKGQIERMVEDEVIFDGQGPDREVIEAQRREKAAKEQENRDQMALYLADMERKRAEREERKKEKMKEMMMKKMAENEEAERRQKEMDEEIRKQYQDAARVRAEAEAAKAAAREARLAERERKEAEAKARRAEELAREAEEKARQEEERRKAEEQARKEEEEAAAAALANINPGEMSVNELLEHMKEHAGDKELLQEMEEAGSAGMSSKQIVEMISRTAMEAIEEKFANSEEEEEEEEDEESEDESEESEDELEEDKPKAENVFVTSEADGLVPLTEGTDDINSVLKAEPEQSREELSEEEQKHLEEERRLEEERKCREAEEAELLRQQMEELRQEELERKRLEREAKRIERQRKKEEQEAKEEEKRLAKEARELKKQEMYERMAAIRKADAEEEAERMKKPEKREAPVVEIKRRKPAETNEPLAPEKSILNENTEAEEFEQMDPEEAPIKEMEYEEKDEKDKQWSMYEDDEEEDEEEFYEDHNDLYYTKGKEDETEGSYEDEEEDAGDESEQSEATDEEEEMPDLGYAGKFYASNRQENGADNSEQESSDTIIGSDSEDLSELREQTTPLAMITEHMQCSNAADVTENKNMNQHLEESMVQETEASNELKESTDSLKQGSLQTEANAMDQEQLEAALRQEIMEKKRMEREAKRLERQRKREEQELKEEEKRLAKEARDLKRKEMNDRLEAIRKADAEEEAERMKKPEKRDAPTEKKLAKRGGQPRGARPDRNRERSKQSDPTKLQDKRKMSGEVNGDSSETKTDKRTFSKENKQEQTENHRTNGDRSNDKRRGQKTVESREKSKPIPNQEAPGKAVPRKKRPEKLQLRPPSEPAEFVVRTSDGRAVVAEEELDETSVVEGRISPDALTGKSKLTPGRALRTDRGVEFIAGCMMATGDGEEFVPGRAVDLPAGAKFVPGQTVATKHGPQFVAGKTIGEGDRVQFVPGHVVDLGGKTGEVFVPGQVMQTDHGLKFIPGSVYESASGPLFVPGRVVNGQFTPGNIVETKTGPRFVAPAVEPEPEEEIISYVVQSFDLDPIELDLVQYQYHSPEPSPAFEGQTIRESLDLLQLAAKGHRAKTLPQAVIRPPPPRSKRQIYESVSATLLNCIARVARAATDGRPPRECLRQEAKRVQRVLADDLNNPLPLSDVAAFLKQCLALPSPCDEVAQWTDGLFGYSGEGVFRPLRSMVNRKLSRKVSLQKTLADVAQQAPGELERARTQDNVLTSLSQLTKKDMPRRTHVDDQRERWQEMISAIILTSGKVILNDVFNSVAYGDEECVRTVLQDVLPIVPDLTSDPEAVNELERSINRYVLSRTEQRLEGLVTCSRDPTPLQRAGLSPHVLLNEAVGLAVLEGESDAGRCLRQCLGSPELALLLPLHSSSMQLLRTVLTLHSLAEHDERRQGYLHDLAKYPNVLRDNLQWVRFLSGAKVITEHQPAKRRRLHNAACIPGEVLQLLSREPSAPLEAVVHEIVADAARHVYAVETGQPRPPVVILKQHFEGIVPREQARDVIDGRVQYLLVDETGVRLFRVGEVEPHRADRLRRASQWAQGEGHRGKPAEESDVTNGTSDTPTGEEHTQPAASEAKVKSKSGKPGAKEKESAGPGKAQSAVKSGRSDTARARKIGTGLPPGELAAQPPESHAGSPDSAQINGETNGDSDRRHQSGAAVTEQQSGDAGTKPRADLGNVAGDSVQSVTSINQSIESVIKNISQQMVADEGSDTKSDANSGSGGP